MENFVDYDSYMNIDKSGIDYKEPIIQIKKKSKKIRVNKFIRNKKFKIKDKKHLFFKSAINYFYYAYFNTDRRIHIFTNLLKKHVLKLNLLSILRLHRRVSDLNESFKKVTVPVNENIILECNKYDSLLIQDKDIFFYGNRVTKKSFCKNMFIGPTEPYMKNYKTFYSEKAFNKYSHKIFIPFDIDYYLFNEESLWEEIYFEDFENELLDKHYAADYFEFSKREEPLDFWLTINDFDYGCKYDITYHLKIDMNEQKAKKLYDSKNPMFYQNDNSFFCCDYDDNEECFHDYLDFIDLED